MDSISAFELSTRFPALKQLVDTFISEKRGEFLTVTFDSARTIPVFIDFFCNKQGFGAEKIKGSRVYGEYKDQRYKVLVAVLQMYQPGKLEKPETRLNEGLADVLKRYLTISPDILSKNVRSAVGLYRISRKHKTRYNEEIIEHIESFLQRPH